MGLSVSRRGSAAASRSGTSRSGARRAMLDFRGRKDAGMDEVLDAVDDSAPGVTVLLGWCPRHPRMWVAIDIRDR